MLLFQIDSFNKFHFIDGTNSKARFGHAVASLQDLNQDGYEGNTNKNKHN